MTNLRPLHYNEHMRNITFEHDIEKNKLNIKANTPISFKDFVETTFNGVLTFARMVLRETKDAHYTAVKEELYDLINVAASNLLRSFAPDLELRPSLTEDAILKAENEIISSKTAEELRETYG